MNLTALWVGLLSSAVGSLGFALIFRVRPRCLFPATLGGTLAFFAYFIFDAFGFHIFLSNFLGAVASAIFSEICARIFKAPSIVFSIPCVIPLVPGSLLYYTMSHLLEGAYSETLSYLSKTLLTALGIAGGLLVVSVFVSFSMFVRTRYTAKKRENASKEA